MRSPTMEGRRHIAAVEHELFPEGVIQPRRPPHGIARLAVEKLAFVGERHDACHSIPDVASECRKWSEKNDDEETEGERETQGNLLKPSESTPHGNAAQPASGSGHRKPGGAVDRLRHPHCRRLTAALEKTKPIVPPRSHVVNASSSQSKLTVSMDALRLLWTLERRGFPPRRVGQTCSSATSACGRRNGSRISRRRGRTRRRPLATPTRF